MAPLAKEESPIPSVPSGLSSLSSSGFGEKVGLRLCFGGNWLQQKDGSFKYVGGETYHEKIPAMKYADLMHYMSEKVNGAVTLKYAPPGEEVDVNNLVTCVDDDHVQEMFDEYFKAAKENDTPGKTFRLKMWLFAAKEEELTPEDISKAKWGKMRLSTPRVEMYKQQNVSVSFGSYDSQGSSNNSSASAGTRSPHVMGRRMLYSGDTAYRPSLNDVEMQEKAAEDAVESMNAEQELYTLAQMPHNMSVALATTYDSSGWPHDRSPFLKARGEATGPSLEGSDRETPRRQLSSRFLAGMDHSQGRGTGVQQGADQGWSLWGNDPMQTGTPHATSGGRRLFTQDSFKEDGDGELEDAGERTQQNGGAATYPPKRRTQRSIHLPSQLGSDVGNAYPYPTGGNSVEVAGHMEELAAGMTDRVLQDWPSIQGGSVGPEAVWGRRLQRTPSRVQVTSDSVYRLPQAEIRVVHTIGEGTFGEVVLATNSVFGKVAVKWLKPAKMDKHKAKFWEEARLLAALNHPNVLRFYGVVVKAADDPTVVGIMTEYMQGSSLSNYLRPGMQPLSLLQRAELARGAVNGLAYLHEMNIVHFDLKPDNLLLDNPLEWNRATPGVKVADFGLSKQKFHKYVSGVRDLRGTLPYMAPELVSDPGHVTEAADIWSLGVVFWEMLTMETPFENLNPVEIVNGLGFGRLRPEIPACCEPQWRSLLEGCLQMDAKHRFTLAEIADRLDDITALPPNPHDFPTPTFLL